MTTRQSIPALLADFRRLGIKLWAEGDRLRYKAPKGALTSALRQQLRQRKAELVAFFQQVHDDTLAPIPPVSREQALPLSFAQQRLWFLDQLEGGSATYNMPSALRLEGTLDFAAFSESLNEIVRRHEALRTSFPMVNGVAVQQIAPPSEMNITIEDLSGLPQEEREAQARLRTREEQAQPFDLANGPLLGVKLLRLAEEEHILLLTMHHIISDGWSIGVFMREFSTLYGAYSKGQPSPLPDLAIQYADFAHWQREWLTGEVLEEQLSYWKKQLADAPALLQLPTDHPRPPIQSFRGGKYAFELSKALSDDLNALSAKFGVTLFMTLQAAFATLLYRYCGQEEILVGTPIANRQRIEIEPLIGFFVNTLVLRTSFASAGDDHTIDDLTFDQLLKRVQSSALEAYKYQDLPFELLVEQLQPERTLSHSPLFQVMFALQNAPAEPRFLSLSHRDASQSKGFLEGLTLTPLEEENTTALFDLSLWMNESPHGLNGFWDYNRDLFDFETMQRMAGHFETLLRAIVANPFDSVTRLPLLSAAEQHKLLVTWNDTEADYPKEQSVYDIFEAQVAQTPDAVAVAALTPHRSPSERGVQLTYRELNARANQLAHYLIKLGVGPEVMVGICIERSIEMMVGLLGILKAGGAYVPLDPHFPTERLAFMLEDSQAKVLISKETLLAEHGLMDHLQDQPRRLYLDRDWPLISQEAQSNPITESAVHDLAYCIYTSGSTGKPKGVQINHQALTNFLTTMQQTPGLSAQDRLLAVTTISFDIAALELYLPLITGATVLLVSREVASDGVALGQVLTNYGATVMQATPATWRILLAAGWTGFDKLKTLCGGEALPRDLANQLLDAGTTLWNMYGPTETTIWSTTTEITRERAQRAAMSIGCPIANTQIYILDRHQKPVPIGVPGDLYIGGDGVARGYLNRPTLNQERFIANPFACSNGFSRSGPTIYNTGDQARYLPDGHIEFLGRNDHQVKVRGFRIELQEIEANLNKHPAIEQAIVLVREDQPGDKRLVAYMTLNRHSPPGTPEVVTPSNSLLREYLGKTLPSYMVPAHFVRLEAMPLTPNGKINRKALAAFAPMISNPMTSNPLVAPRTPTEARLAEIWGEILNVPQVGINDNFFELGGHSLLATQVVSRMRDALQIEVPLRHMFEFPTIAQLNQQLYQAQKAKTPIKAVSREGDLPLSFSQQRLWFLEQLEEGSATYNMPSALRIDGALNLTALRKSVNEIARRHEILRTSFPMVEGVPVQRIAPPTEIPIEMVDLTIWPEEEREAKAQAWAMEEQARPFDLANGPLVRVILLQLGADSHILLTTMHHIISDGWSIGVFIRELSALYNAYLKGLPSPLPELPIQYADFAHWQREWLTGEVLEKQLDYWKQQVAGVPGLLQLPTDRPRPPIQSFRGGLYSHLLPQTLLDGLKDLSLKFGTTLFTTLQAAFATLLYRYAGEEEILVGTPIANRNRAEIEPLVGFFVNTLLLRTSFAPEISTTNEKTYPTFAQILNQARSMMLSAQEQQDLPFELLVEHLQPERSLSHSPLFQVMFAFQNVPHTSARSLNTLDLAGLRLTPLEIESVTAKFDLNLAMREEQTGPLAQRGLIGEWEYNSDLFELETIQRMANHFQALLSAIVADPFERVDHLPLLSAAEREQLLVGWNDTQVDYPNNKHVHTLFEEKVEQTPDAIAVVFASSDGVRAQLTYRELNRRANQLAHYLIKLGVGPDVPVGLSVERSLDMAVGLLGILKAGGAYLPLDPAYPQERLRFMLADANAPVLLTQEGLQSLFPAHEGHVVCLDTQWQTIALESDANPTLTVSPEDLLYIIYTSGSTGRPKGIMLSHRALSNLILWHLETLEVGVGVLQFASLSFDASFHEMFAAWCSGGTLFIVSETLRLQLDQFSHFLAKNPIRKVVLPVVVLQQLAETQPAYLFKKLTEITTTGEQLQITQPIIDLFKQLPNSVLHNHYGPSETHVVTAYTFTGEPETWPIYPPIGKPIANTQIYILDHNYQPVPIGVVGFLFLGGTNLARGYLGRPELTAQKFIPNPFASPDADNNDNLPFGYNRLYNTGDLARYLPDGNIEFLGRVDHQVKVRGFRVELGEIEAMLNKHPQISQAVVSVQGGEQGTSEKRMIVAYVVLQQNESASSGELRAFLEEKLPDYMIPAIFVLLETLPLTPSGKVNRRALPKPDRSAYASEFVAPRTSAEGQLASIWCQILNISRVGVYDNFFEVGGHSLLATQVVSKVRNAFQVELPIRSLFEKSTIASLAEQIELLQAAQDLLADEYEMFEDEGEL